jgi:hypothetical protein
VRGQAPNWPTVDPEALRSWSDCETWEDLDYFIAAVGSMIRVQILWAAAGMRVATKRTIASGHDLCASE